MGLIGSTEMTDRRQNILNINVGILGHVDSGKTSLVKALSTSLSTAALDKHPQSQQRGITLDLGFSSFTLPLPPHLAAEFGSSCPYDTLQFTLVDCPGHASLIRTIIGGAQIIDMIILVVDANKGIQTQTAECIVIGEITSDNMIIALNKIDTIAEEDRPEKIEKASKKISKVLAASKFPHAKIIPLSAVVGGEKVAAVVSGSSSHSAAAKQTAVKSMGVEDLITEIVQTVKLPHRNINAPFYYSIDHCFPIKGHGTVLTGTVLSGSVSVNSHIEIPHLRAVRKVKSMQMFHKPVDYAKQGDRVGICVTNLDAKSIERSIACAPDSVPLVSSALCLVKKVRFFKMSCKSGMKFHITVGHETVIGTVVFFGAEELQQASQLLTLPDSSKEEGAIASTTPSVDKLLQSMRQYHATYNPSLHGNFQQGFPQLDFPVDAEYLYQDKIRDTEGLVYGHEPAQWALIDFQHTIHCPLGSLIIGSKLDADTSDSRSSGAHMCRLAFFGPLKAIVYPADGAAAQHPLAFPLPALGVYIWKEKYCEVVMLSDVRKGGCVEVVGWKLVSERTSIQTYVGMKVLAPTGQVGSIVSAYGADGQFRVKFKVPVQLVVGDKLMFRYKRYVYNKARTITQEVYVEDVGSQEGQAGLENEMEHVKIANKSKERKKTMIQEEGGSVSAPPIRDKTPAMCSTTILPSTPSSPMLALSSEPNPVIVGVASIDASNIATDQNESVTTPVSPDEASPPLPSETAVEEMEGELREGKVESTKVDGEHLIAIISGAFRMEENVKLYVGSVVVTSTGVKGNVTASFGKLGKCKVMFAGGCSLPTGEGVCVYTKLLS
ncbi:GTP-binding protein [archaeon]|nr:MAG: GTP-binding protein [archaeon]